MEMQSEMRVEVQEQLQEKKRVVGRPFGPGNPPPGRNGRPKSDNEILHDAMNDAMYTKKSKDESPAVSSARVLFDKDFKGFVAQYTELKKAVNEETALRLKEQGVGLTPVSMEAASTTAGEKEQKLVELGNKLLNSFYGSK